MTGGLMVPHRRRMGGKVARGGDEIGEAPCQARYCRTAAEDGIGIGEGVVRALPIRMIRFAGGAKMGRYSNRRRRRRGCEVPSPSARTPEGSLPGLRRERRGQG